MLNAQFPDSLRNDSLPAITVTPAERRPVVIEREVSLLRSLQLRSTEEITHAFFRETPSLHIPQPETQIRIDRVDVDDIGMSHIKGVQLYRNTPVYGMDFTFHISAHSELFMGYTVDTTFIDTSSVRLSASEAIRLAEADLSLTTTLHPPGEFMKEKMNYEGPEASIVYYPDRFDVYRLCYRIVIRPNFRDEWIYHIHAQSGEVMDKYNNTPTDGANKGTGRDLNNVQRTVDTYLENNVHYMINTTKPMFKSADFSGAISVYDLRNNKNYYTPEGASVYMVTNNSTQWNNPTAISTMYHATLVYDYLRQTHNRNSFDNKGSGMNCYINLPHEDGGGLDNAFWNGSFVSLGNGRTICSPLAGALDVIAHEFGHAVIQFSANLEYKNQSGAINETYADIFGCMVDRANWTLGENVMNKAYFPTGAMRDMSNPHNGGRNINDNGWQPAHVSEMYLGTDDNGGVHTNSGIGNYAFYTYATATSKEKAERVFCRALFNYLTPTSKFLDFRIAVIQSAKDLYGAADAQLVAGAFDKVGILEDSGSTAKPPELPTNPGQQGLLLANLDMTDRYGIYKTTNYTSFTPVSTSRIINRPSITDDGSFVVFINDREVIRALDITKGDEVSVSSDAGYSGVAVSRDGNRLAFVTSDEDGLIYVYDFVSGKMANFRLYNPTTGTGGARTYNVKYADAIEFDHSGEYLIYDAYNTAGGKLSGGTNDYWDIGSIHVWNNSKKTFGTGEIDKLFATLEPGMSVGNPTFSKKSPHIIAFDYLDSDGIYATLGVNLLTGDMDAMFKNTTTAYPNFSMDDKTIAFTSYDEDTRTYFTGYIGLTSNKLGTTGNGKAIANETAFPIYYGTGTRQLGVRPEAAFTADIRQGGRPLSVQFVDLSENSPTSRCWTFQGGSPSSSTQQHPRVTYSSTGTYPVRLTATNSYGSHELVKQGYISVGATDIEFIEQESLVLFPNPATDFLMLKGLPQNTVSINVFDITGRNAIVSFTADNDAIRVDVSALPPGLYLLRATLPQGKTVTQKFVKK
jgi:Zn-dependent metalloprotease/PKD repeat protein